MSATLGGDSASLSDGPHTFSVRAIDAVGNVDPSPATRTWTMDSVRPSGSMIINGGRTLITSRTVTLKLSASDPAPASGIAQMRIKNTGGIWTV